MARRPPPPPSPQRPTLSVEEKRRGILRLRRRIDQLAAFDTQLVTRRHTDPNVRAIENAIDEALTAVFGHETVEYRRYARAANLDHGPNYIRPDMGGGRGYDDSAEARQYVSMGKADAIILLEQAIRSLEEEIEEHGPESVNESPLTKLPDDMSKVFIVHGHDEGAKEAVARFLERLGIRVIVLHEQANQGMTVIEKVEVHSEVRFAVVLLTPDDEGCVKGGTPSPRARQNVLLELGYFIGRLGRQHVCALRRGHVEIPSDFAGVVAESLDDAGGWRQKLATELGAAGFQIDWNKVMRS